jgi:hypothetical protein
MYIRLAEILNGLRGKGYEGIDENVRCALVEILNDLVRLMLSIRMEKVRSNTTTVDYSMLTEGGVVHSNGGETVQGKVRFSTIIYNQW